MERRQSFSSLPPVIFHKYEVEKILENGDFGEVLKAYRTNKNNVREPVTIKTFRENHKSLDELDLSEIETISQISHDNVVQIYDTVWHINSGGVELYLVYQYCVKGDLQVYVNDHGRFTELEVRDFVKQMAQGMLILRRYNIIHRDLKPSNILVEDAGDGEVVFKIADMGLTKLFFDEQQGIAFCDCPVFIAPEVLKASNSFITLMEDNKIDLWSLGVLILFCLNGEAPFNGSDVSQYSNDKEIDVPSQIAKGCNRELKNLILGLVRLNPAERLGFGSLVGHPFLKSFIWFVRPYNHCLPCSDVVTSLCFDHQYILCGLESGLIEVFERVQFSRFRRLDFHRKTVSALAINKDIIISGSQDTTIAVWSREKFERLQILYHHRNTIIGIEIIGTSAYSACLDGTHKAFSIDFKKLYARRNGFNQRRYSIQEHSNEEFKEEIEFQDDKSGKLYPAHWRDHDHMHTVTGIIVILIYVAEDNEFRPFHILSSRAFNCLKPQLMIRMRDDGNEHFVRKLIFDSHVRQIKQLGGELFLLHWDGKISLFLVDEILSPVPNDELMTKNLVENKSAASSDIPTWFCVQPDAVASYTNDYVSVLEYKL